jgi:hypothetical protein
MAAPTLGELVLEVLPAREGDALLLNWGPSEDRHRMLVDVGPAPAYDDLCPRLIEVAREGHIDVLVMTHIDKDHIEGAILLTNDAEVDLKIDEMWFNGSGQLVPELNALHGEIFTENLVKRGIPWNVRFDGGPVCATAPERPVRELPGGLRVTVLGPDRDMLPELRDHWDQACADAGLKYSTLDKALDALRRRRKLEPEGRHLPRPAGPARRRGPGHSAGYPGRRDRQREQHRPAGRVRRPQASAVWRRDPARADHRGPASARRTRAA